MTEQTNHNCMDKKPTDHLGRFTCPICEQSYKQEEVWPSEEYTFQLFWVKVERVKE